MNSYKKLVNNSIIFAIGNFGSRLISFLLVPIYTHYLSTSEYGALDLVNTTVAMLIPIVAIDMYDAIFRFIMEKDSSNKNILSNGVFVAVCGLLISLLIYPILNYYNFLGEYLIYMYIILTLQIFRRILSQYSRGIGLVKLFAADGILLTLSTGLLNILFLVVLNYGVDGYFLALIFSNIISILNLSFRMKIYNNLSVNQLNLPTIKKLIHYAAPLIPNSIMWSLINSSSRYFIIYFVGVSANGLFAVANKIPTILNTFSQIFYQSWILSAIEEKDNENVSSFYSNVFKHYSSIVLILVSGIILVTKPMFSILFAEEYYMGWQVVPILLLSTAFSIFSSFLGVTYITAKETGGVFRTSIYGGGISLILNIILIPAIGLMGAAISSVVSFFVMFLLRLSDTRKYIDLNINWKLYIYNITIILLQTITLFLGLNFEIEIIVNGILFIFLIIANRHLLNILKAIINGRERK